MPPRPSVALSLDRGVGGFVFRRRLVLGLAFPLALLSLRLLAFLPSGLRRRLVLGLDFPHPRTGNAVVLEDVSGLAVLLSAVSRLKGLVLLHLLFTHFASLLKERSGRRRRSCWPGY